MLPQCKLSNAFNIITGDININILDKNSLKVQNYLNILCENGYVSLLNQPTRLSKKSAGYIDHIFAGPIIVSHFKSFVLKGATSDHFSTLLTIKLEKEINSDKYMQITEINKQKFVDMIREETWEDVFLQDDPNICMDKLLQKIKQYLEECTTLKNRKMQPILKNWVTPGIMIAIKKRDKMHMICRKQPFNPVAQLEYKQYRNKLNKNLSWAKVNYFKEKIQNAEGDKRKIWSVINEATEYKSKKTDEIKKLKLMDP